MGLALSLIRKIRAKIYETYLNYKRFGIFLND